MIFKGKYKNIIFTFLVFCVLGFLIWFYEEYKYLRFSKNLKLEHLIGQRIMTAPENHELSAAFIDLIKKYHIGNIKIYGYNYKNKEQVYNLIIECQNLALKYNHGIPMFVATDQEGGWIAHLKKGFTIPPSHYAIGKQGKRELAYLSGKIIARELATIGVNMNFAPVGDLSLNEENWVIGPRSFGSSPESVVGLMSDFIKAHTEENILPIIKHFPGIGRMKNDPHVHPLTNKIDYKTLVKVDLKPFLELLRSYGNGVMIGNVAVPSIVKFMESKNKTNYEDSYYTLAPLSEVIIKKYLIQYHGYFGLIISDEVNVLPIRKLMPVERAAYLVLKSGVDILLINKKPEKIRKIIKYLIKKYDMDKEFRKQMKISVKKILRYKAFIFKKNRKPRFFAKKYLNIPEFESNPDDLSKINCEAHKKINNQISVNTIDINKNEDNLIPLSGKINTSSQKFFVISSKTKLFNELKKYVPYKNLKFIKIKPYITDKLIEEDINLVLNSVDRKSFIIAGILSKNQAKIIKQVYKKNKNIIIINLLHPYNIRDLSMVKTILSTYSDNDAQVRAAVEVLFEGKNHNKKIKDVYLTY